MQVHNCEQGTPEWLDLRCGLVTASSVKNIITPKGKISEAKAREDYLFEIIAEKLSGVATQTFVTPAMMRGKEDEPDAKLAYEEKYSVKVNEVGFITDNINGVLIGYSPDGLVGDDGLIEIKSRTPRLQIETLLNSEMPSEYMAQIQTGMLVTGREWCDFVSYAKDLPMFVKRIYADANYYNAIISGVDNFYKDVENKIKIIMEKM